MESTNLNEKNYILSSLEEFFEGYTVITVEEYFRLLNKETLKRSQMVSKSLTKYLNQYKKSSKYDKLRKTAMA